MASANLERTKVRWENPYKQRLTQHPGRIFCFDDFDADRRAVSMLCGGRSHIYGEIGSGSGNHMLALAVRHPDALFFGFEVRYKRAVRTIEKAQVLGVHNVFVCRTQGEFIDRIFAPAQLSGIYVNFPDPWDGKKKWKKNQVLNLDFLSRSDALLHESGFISIKTDHAGYFREFLRTVEDHGTFIPERRTEDLYTSKHIEGNIPSEFENLFRKKCMPICYTRLIRCQRRCAALGHADAASELREIAYG